MGSETLESGGVSMGTTKYFISMLMVAVAFTQAGKVSAETGSGGQMVNMSALAEDDQIGFCMKFEQAEDDVDIETMFENMEKVPYAKEVKDFWTTPACHAPQKPDIKVPILFNTANNTPKNETFPRAVHDYFVEEKHNPKAWLEIVHAKSTDGSTILDFIQYNLNENNYRLEPSKDAAARIIKYLCQNGGVYSKYKDTAHCP
jgi:hypothetical protein